MGNIFLIDLFDTELKWRCISNFVSFGWSGAVVFLTLLLYNSIIGMFIYYNYLTTNINIIFVYCHELAPMFTVMSWLQISLFKQVIGFVATTVNIVRPLRHDCTNILT